MGEDPWAKIDPPSIADSVAARRVDATLPWNFFWARGVDGRVLLTLQHATGSAPTTQLPRLRDIEVSLSPPDESDTQLLALKLLDSNQRDIFQALCLDIISTAAQAESEAEAVSAALMRTWRWHHLLRGGRGTLLSPRNCAVSSGAWRLPMRHQRNSDSRSGAIRISPALSLCSLRSETVTATASQSLRPEPAGPTAPGSPAPQRPA